ncbi:class I SAM-dependent methyltransferase [Mesorhizobium newzealandense]|uniref:Class I SAM-dependent methyltransferase n=1 Tax=Mesorhizobium newzealandense TaxID=1300302 RepID=A0ABW4UGH4_9HYPH
MTAADGLEAVDAPCRPDPTEFIRANMRVAPVPSLPEIRLYTPHPASGLRRLTDPQQSSDAYDDTAEADDDGPEPQPPYWAYVWAGGAVLARHILDHPQTVAGRRVLDLGAGSGLVVIAAAKAGASAVIAAEIDRNGVAALALNAAANGVAMTVMARDITGGPPPAVDVVTVGDVFYGQDVADRVMPFLERCLGAGMEVLVGDPGRAYLPRQRLHLLAEYKVPDFGQTKDSALKLSGVFRFEG